MGSGGLRKLAEESFAQAARDLEREDAERERREAAPKEAMEAADRQLGEALTAALDHKLHVQVTETEEDDR